MSKPILTRYNAFIPETTKPGYFSCPHCYKLSKGASAAQLQCAHCGVTAPILTNPTAIITATLVIPAVKEFNVTGLSAGIQLVGCPSCGHNSGNSIGAFTAQCSSCGLKAPVSYRTICNACLVASPAKIVKATYLCSNPGGRHSAGHNSGLTQAGKCASHKCSYDCKRI